MMLKAGGKTEKAREVPFKITNPERIPVQRYYDEEFFKLEQELLWPHVWQMACRLEEIPEVGDYTTYQILDKSVIVVRTASGVKAFHNACRHRGVQLTTSSGNCTKGLICPFHGWRWNMDGKNTFVFGKNVFSPENLDKAELNLVPCRVELWGGSAFINFDDSAPTLLECLGPVAPRLSARNVEELKMEWWCSTVLPTNWKLAMEAFQEGYHTMRTHPQLNINMSPEMNMYGQDAGMPIPPGPQTPAAFVDLTITFMERLNEGMAGMIHSSEVEIAKGIRNMDLPADVPGAAGAFYGRLNHEITTQGRARGLPVPDLNQLAARGDFHAVEFMFPHYFLLPFFSSMSSYRIRPLTPETCLFEIWSLTFIPEDDNRKRVTAPTQLPYDSKDFPPIPQQDYANLPLQQKGLHAKGFEYMRLSRQVEGMLSNYQRLIDGYLGGVDPQKLAKASQIVNAGFESTILDIGI